MRPGASDRSRPRSSHALRSDRMSNCVVVSRGLGLPGGTVANDGVEGSDHFAHDSNDDDLWLLAGGSEAFAEGLERAVVAARAESGHVEDVADWHAAAVD